MSCEVIVTSQAEEHLRRLARQDRAVALAALKLAKQLRANPYLGDELRPRPRLESLSDCRRIRFDRAGWRGKPRYRLVYRNEPSDGAPHIVAVLAVGPRERMRAYRAAVRSKTQRLRELRGGQDQPWEEYFDRG